MPLQELYHNIMTCRFCHWFIRANPCRTCMGIIWNMRAFPRDVHELFILSWKKFVQSLLRIEWSIYGDFTYALYSGYTKTSSVSRRTPEQQNRIDHESLILVHFTCINDRGWVLLINMYLNIPKMYSYINIYQSCI